VAIPANVTKFTIVWSTEDGEIANSSFWVAGFAPTSDSALQAACLQVANLLDGTSIKAALRALVESDTVLSTVKGYSYPTGGPVAAHVASQGATTGYTGTGTNPHPLQVSLVATLHTGFSGRSRRGRMYFPANGCAMSGNRFSSTPAANLSSGLATFFTAVNAASPDLGAVAVVSQRLSDAIGVSSVSTDTRPDIQRRRADRQPVGIVTTSAVS